MGWKNEGPCEIIGKLISDYLGMTGGIDVNLEVGNINLPGNN